MPPFVSKVSLTVEDIAATEVWLRIGFADAAAPREFSLRRNGTVVASGTFTGTDTLVGDPTLRPLQVLSYKAFRMSGGIPVDSSTALSVTTRDTTSHLFSSIRIDTLGNVSPSALYDVAILGPDDIIAVGEIYRHGPTVDTLYNMARWDGQQWNLMKIQFLTFCGQPATSVYPTRALFAFSLSDIWISSGSQIVRWNGSTQSPPECIPVSVNALWGENANSVFAVGYGGAVAHFDGTSWTRLESGTTATINDIWGAVDGEGKRTVLCAVSNHLQGGEHKILSIDETGAVDSLHWVSEKEVYSIWFDSPARLFTAGEGLFSRGPDMMWNEFLQTPRIYTYRIRGPQANDLMISGGFGLVLHWNGVSFNEYPEAAATAYTCAYNGTLMVAVGYRGALAVVAQMRR